MANRERGEHALVINGRPLTASPNVNAIVQLEERFGLTFGEILDRIRARSVTHMRALVWAAIVQHHPDFPIEEVGTLNLGELSECARALIIETAPDPKDAADLKLTPADPQTTQGETVGTGGASTSRLAASA